MELAVLVCLSLVAAEFSVFAAFVCVADGGDPELVAAGPELQAVT
jgi:hypothetical protein